VLFSILSAWSHGCYGMFFLPLVELWLGIRWGGSGGEAVGCCGRCPQRGGSFVERWSLGDTYYASACGVGGQDEERDCLDHATSTMVAVEMAAKSLDESS